MRSSSFWFLLYGILIPGILFILGVYFNVNVLLIIAVLTYMLTAILIFMPKRTGAS